MNGLNLLRDGYEHCAAGVASHIMAGRSSYKVFVKPSGTVLIAETGPRCNVREKPPQWWVGNYTRDGLQTNHVEDDLLLRERELRALESAMAAPRVKP